MSYRYYEEVRNPYHSNKDPGNKLIAIFDWATLTDKEVPCDGCGIFDQLKLQNVIVEWRTDYGQNGNGGQWVSVLCVRCFDLYGGIE